MCQWKNRILCLLLKLISQSLVEGFKNHSALSSIVFTNIDPPDGTSVYIRILKSNLFYLTREERSEGNNAHSEYFYGRCAKTDKILLAHQQWTYEELVGKLIVRSWLDVEQVPNCVYIKSKSNYAELVRYHSYKFNVCICVLVYNYGGQKFTYTYYEWYIPVEMMKNINWDIFFYISYYAFVWLAIFYVLSLHSEYLYGNCKERATLKFYVHQHLDHIEVLGKTIIRGWLDLYRIPTCIILRAHSHEEDTFRSTAYNFQICVPRITYCHSKRRFKYYYYEWYIPSDYIGGMNWDLYFFGPPSPAW